MMREVYSQESPRSLPVKTDLAIIFSLRRGGFLPVNPLHLLGEYEPTGRYLFECALYGQVPCFRRALANTGRTRPFRE